VIDLHCHVLPGFDDGPSTLEQSLALARAAAEAGTTVLAATPHVRADYSFPPEEVRPAVEELNRSLGTAEVPIEVVPGGEVAITSLVELTEHELAAVTLDGGPCLLVESPYVWTGDVLERILSDAQGLGLLPILAHPERSPCFLGDLDRLRALVERGVLCSITAGSMAGRFGRPVRTFTARLFEAGLVHDVASDAHGGHQRPPGLRVGFEQLDRELPGLLDQVDWYTRLAPAAILGRGRLPPRPAPPASRSHGGRLTSKVSRRLGV
jgi:protein-tyrosine phosphatase